LPRGELHRLSEKMLDEHYKAAEKAAGGEAAK